MLSKRDGEILRLRAQRDQVSAEVNERREKEKARLSTTAEFKTLAEARGVCLVFIASVSHAHLPIGTHSHSRIGDKETESSPGCQRR